jgi:hypothetical protein
MTFADELRSRLKAKQKEWEKYKDQVREAKEKEAKARDQLDALQVLLHDEQPKGNRETGNQAQVPLPIAPEANKAEIVRLLIQERGSSGLVPAQIRALLEEKSVQMPTNYLYAILLRAKKAGHIAERSGRYYPAEQKEKVAS